MTSDTLLNLSYMLQNIFFFTLCIATRTIQLWYISKNLAFLVPYLLFLMVQVMDIQWNELIAKKLFLSEYFWLYLLYLVLRGI